MKRKELITLASHYNRGIISKGLDAIQSLRSTKQDKQNIKAIIAT